MSNVVVLSDYKHRKKSKPEPAPQGPPLIRDRDVWGRDFTVQENAVFALLKVREILLYYLDTEEEWSPLLLRYLEEIERARQGEENRLKEAATDVKNYVAFELDPWNAKEMRAALMLLDLIEKSMAKLGEV
jgi:hypothetical protein